MAKVQTKDHEMVSIYPLNEEETEQLMNNAVEAVLMWSTKDGWPVGVTHAFVWHDGKIWLTFTAQRHRAAAIRRDNRVSVNVSSASYPEGTDASFPTGAITFKGHGEFFERSVVAGDFLDLREEILSAHLACFVIDEQGGLIQAGGDGSNVVRGLGLQAFGDE